MSTRSAPVHVSTALYCEEYDFKCRLTPPSIELMIAAAPRSGSTAFCLELWRTGVLGAPLEYANFELLGRIPRWRTARDRGVQYWKELQAIRTSTNGVFAYKFFAANYVQIARTAPELLPLVAPSHVIYLTREDLLAQAISYSKASRSGVWFGGGAPVCGVPFDEAHVKELYQSIRRQMASWERIFELTKASVLRVTYEEMLRDPKQVVSKSVRHVLGDSARLQPLDLPELAIQRNEESEGWKERLQVIECEWRAMTP
jgi:LPS sulfotransferase NodH